MKKHLMTIALILLLCLSVPAYAYTVQVTNGDLEPTMIELPDLPSEEYLSQFVPEGVTNALLIIQEDENGEISVTVVESEEPDHFLEDCMNSIPDKEQTLLDLVTCFFMLDGLQEYNPGGFDKSELDPCIEYIEFDASSIIETDKGITLKFSDNFEVAFLFAEGSDELITQAKMLLTVENVVMPDDFCYTITVQF